MAKAVLLSQRCPYFFHFGNTKKHVLALKRAIRGPSLNRTSYGSLANAMFQTQILSLLNL